MTKYEALIEESDRCVGKAQKTTDRRLERFFMHASKGLKTKASNLLKCEVVVLVAVLLSSCQIMTESEAQDAYLLNQLAEYTTYTCDWINGIESVRDMQDVMGDNITYQKHDENKTTVQSPEETCILGTGDCEEMSLLMIDILFVRFGLDSNLVAVNAIDCKSIVSGGTNINHAIVECGDIYYEATAPYYYFYTDVDVCYRYTFAELFPETE